MARLERVVRVAPPAERVSGQATQNTPEVPAPAGSPNAGQIGRMVTTTGSQIGRAIVCAPTCNNVTDADFGFIEAATVEGTVYHDVNHDGVQTIRAGR